jgi:hypothetical protein
MQLVMDVHSFLYVFAKHSPVPPVENLTFRTGIFAVTQHAGRGNSSPVHETEYARYSLYIRLSRKKLNGSSSFNLNAVGHADEQLKVNADHELELAWCARSNRCCI